MRRWGAGAAADLNLCATQAGRPKKPIYRIDFWPKTGRNLPNEHFFQLGQLVASRQEEHGLLCQFVAHIKII